MAQRCAFTVIYNPGTENMEEYRAYFDNLSAHDITVDIGNFESNSRGVAHFHGVLRFPSRMRFRELHQHLRSPGFNYRKEEIYDDVGWKQYYDKNFPDGKERDVYDRKWNVWSIAGGSAEHRAMYIRCRTLKSLLKKFPLYDENLRVVPGYRYYDAFHPLEPYVSGYKGFRRTKKGWNAYDDEDTFYDTLEEMVDKRMRS